jgi:hypothetical protein
VVPVVLVLPRGEDRRHDVRELSAWWLFLPIIPVFSLVVRHYGL